MYMYIMYIAIILMLQVKFFKKKSKTYQSQSNHPDLSEGELAQQYTYTQSRRGFWRGLKQHCCLLPVTCTRVCTSSLSLLWCHSSLYLQAHRNPQPVYDYHFCAHSQICAVSVQICTRDPDINRKKWSVERGTPEERARCSNKIISRRESSFGRNCCREGKGGSRNWEYKFLLGLGWFFPLQLPSFLFNEEMEF